MELISIVGHGSISPVGSMINEVWESYLSNKHFLSKKEDVFIGAISEKAESLLSDVRLSDNKYKGLDKTVLMAIYASRLSLEQSGWKEKVFGINIGSSRGATELFETYYNNFKESKEGKTHPLTSPTTTLGNLSTWVAHDLQSKGPTISHSITCSTALHALLNGVAWLRSGMSERFIVGATEAPNTDFTISQMKAIKIYSDRNDEYPSRVLDFQKEKNTMCLGEGAVSFCLEIGESKKALAYIESVGYATEELEHNISITEDAKCFQESMKMAIQNLKGDIDVVVMHAPGTIKGDLSEYKAIEKVFGDQKPVLTSNKWKIGHTLGTSGALSMEMAILMLQKQEFIGIPYLKSQDKLQKIERIMVNAVGFGGNAVSVVLKRNTDFI